MKRLIYCLDGTANEYDDAYPTNVVIMDKSIGENDNGIKQIKYYHEGVGTDTWESILGGAFGYGLFDNVIDSYKHLCEHYEQGDEIYIFGFSRGAFTARSFAGLIGYCGVLSFENLSELNTVKKYYKDRLTTNKDKIEKFNKWRMENSKLVCANDEDYTYRRGHLDNQEVIPAILKIKYIGIWDTVKTLGFIKKYDWHDANLSSHVEYARHAIALDERREKFNVTKWDNVNELNRLANKKGKKGTPYQQLWFPGTHGSVGGGGVHRGLSDEAFQWIREGAKEAGLKFIDNGDAEIFSLKPNALDWIYNSTGEDDTWNKQAKSLFLKVVYKATGTIDRDGPLSLDELHQTVKIRFLAKEKYLPENKLYRPESLSILEEELSNIDEIYEESDYEIALYNRDNIESKEESTIVNINNEEFYIYIVKQRDNLSTISQLITGKASNFKKIQEANEVSIPDENKIYIGQRIFIPIELVLKSIIENITI